MKAFTREMILIVESVLFWIAALPLAFLAWPMLLLTEKVRNVALLANRSRKPVAPRLSYHPARS